VVKKSPKEENLTMEKLESNSPARGVSETRGFESEKPRGAVNTKKSNELLLDPVPRGAPLNKNMGRRRERHPRELIMRGRKKH